MKTFFGGLIGLVLVIGFGSCQKEVDGTLDNRVTTNDTIIPMFKIVEIDKLSPGQDSLIRILKTVITGGQKSVVLSEIYPDSPGDTVNTAYTYNSQGLLSGINWSTSRSPAISLASYRFTWSGNRLIKVVCDTSGSFANSVDFNYSPSGTNTVITAIETPTRDFIEPNSFSKTKHAVTVNDQFVPTYEKWISHVYFFQGGVPENYHDTANIYYSYTMNDVSSYNSYFSRHDTSGSGGSITGIERDTTQALYGRSSSGNNIADTLKKIYGKDVYTLMNFNLLEFYEYRPVFFNIWENTFKQFYYRPLTTLGYSKRVWVNGVFDPSQSPANVQEKKIVNSFDAQGRLVKSETYEDFILVNIAYIYKVTYY
jgi:hypothetical protein